MSALVGPSRPAPALRSVPRVGIFVEVVARSAASRRGATATEECTLRRFGRGRNPAWWVVTVLLAIAVPGVVVGMSGSASVHFRSRQSAAPGQAPPGDRPNIVIIQTDDQNVEQMAAMPHVNDLLGRQGTTYTQYLVSFPLCCPSRATLLTGMYAHNTGVEGNVRPHGGYTRFRQGETLPVWLSRAGYRTGHIGKFLNVYGRRDPREIPLGWAEWVTAPFPDEHQYFDYRLNVNGTLVDHGHADSDYIDDVYTDAALDFVRRHAPEPEPFYLALDYLAPHEGVTHEPGRCGASARPAPRHVGTFGSLGLPRPPSFDEADVSDKPAAIRERPTLTPGQVTSIAEDYQCRREALLAVDEGIGRLVEELAASGELDRTFLVFISDNGYFQGEHRVPLGKTRAYDVANRVPCIIRGPGVAEGRLLDNPVANIDIAPTMLDAAGATGEVPVRFALDGHSLLPQLTGQATDDPSAGPERGVLLENGYGYPSGPGYRGIRTRRYVYLEYVTGERELYDLERDPFELDSRHADPAYAGVRAALEPALAALRGCVGRSCDVAVEPPEPAPLTHLARRDGR